MTSRLTAAREQVSKLHSTFEQMVRDCPEGLIRKTELQKFIGDSRAQLKEILDGDTRAFRVFEKLSAEFGSFWVNDNRSPYAERSDCTKAEDWLGLLASVLRELDPVAAATAATNQFVLRAGDKYGSIRTVLRVMKGAQKSLTIVDPYLDSVVFDYLDEIDPGVELRLLTGGKPKPMFVQLLREFRKQRTAAARSSDQSHDRFFILDETEIWQMGCSLNGVGHATSMLNKVVEPAAKQKLFDEYDIGWRTGTSL